MLIKWHTCEWEGTDSITSGLATKSMFLIATLPQTSDVIILIYYFFHIFLMPEIPSTSLLSQLNKILKRRKKESLWSWLSLCPYLSCLYIIYVLKYIYMSCNNSLLFQVLKNSNKTSFSSKSVYFTALSYHQVAWYS